MTELKKVTIHGSIESGGDGSAYVNWYLNYADAVEVQSNLEDWGEECIESIETFEGSKVHTEAVQNSKEYAI